MNLFTRCIFLVSTALVLFQCLGSDEDEEPRNIPPDKPSNPSPANGALNQGFSVTLSWTGGDSDAVDEIRYDLFLGTDSNALEETALDLAATSYELTGLQEKTTYFWRIISSDGNDSAVGNTWYFTTRAENITVTAIFDRLLFNDNWYRSFDSSSSISITAGELLFAWILLDTAQVPDSFYVGIDTLWILPQEEFGGVEGNRWDLQVCPNEECIQGVNDQVFGGNAPVPFNSELGFEGEHHFQFIPAIDANDLINLPYIAPESTIVGGMMYANSRTTGLGDTVFAFGAWHMLWDESFPPPVKPVDGYIPKRSDFEIVDGKVRYTGP